MDELFAQLLPDINWGMVAVVLSPKILQESYQSLYYKMLTLLGVTGTSARNGGHSPRDIRVWAFQILGA